MYFHFAEPYKHGRKVQHLDVCHDFKAGLSKISINIWITVYIYIYSCFKHEWYINTLKLMNV